MCPLLTNKLWIRAPGCVAHALLTWISLVETAKRVTAGLPVARPLLLPLSWLPLAVAVGVVSFLWNGLYFLRRVLVSQALYERDARQRDSAESFDEKIGVIRKTPESEKSECADFD